MIPHWFHNAPVSVGAALIACVALALASLILEQHCKHRERHSNVVPFRKRAGWGFVDYRGCARRRR